jgi:pilus assembly protein CpaF
MTISQKEIFEQTLLDFLGPVRPYLEQDGVSEIMINGPDTIYIERSGRIERVEARFDSVESLMAALRNLAQYVGRSFGEDRPVLEGHLPDGSRVEAIIPPAAPDGPCVAIRRFYREKLTGQALIDFGSITGDALAFVTSLVACKQNVIVAGGTASGKTSLLNVLSSFIDDGERIVVIEDARELQLQKSHVVQLEAQPGDARGRGKVTVRDLFKATLRMRPDRIVVGEIRGGEALDLLQAMTSGHGGCMSTVHASTALDTLNRLETMAMMSEVNLPLHAVRAQVASAINFIVHGERLRDGARVISSITEVLQYDPDRGYLVRDMFRRAFHGQDASGRMHSSLEPTGELPGCTDYLRAHGHELPQAMLAAATRRRSAGSQRRAPDWQEEDW